MATRKNENGKRTQILRAATDVFSAREFHTVPVEDIATSFRSSLAVAGHTGTVKARMRGTPASGNCQVKTGTLRGVSALAGYCRTAGGRDIGFALMFNRANTFVAKARENRIAAAIARLTTPADAPPQEGGALPEVPA
jgi:D-alanyl-D-alanine carboxypeptidase